MATDSNNKPNASFEPLWDSETVARFIGKSAKSLEADRWLRVGIPYIRLGRAVRYDPSDVRAFIAANKVRPSGGEAA
jgi:hypothetical protein